MNGAGQRRGVRPTRGYRVFRAVNGVVLTGFVLVTLYPMVNVVARSLSDRQAIAAGQVNLLPKGFNVDVYRFMLSNAGFWTGYRNTVVYSIGATLVSMVLTTSFAYVLSKKHLRGRGLLTVLAVVTMFFPVTLYLRNVAVESSPNVEATACVVLGLPIVLAYPLVQRYFVAGVLLGAIKE